MIITRDDQVITVLPVDPPLLSDHSFVVADCDCLPSSVKSVSYRQVRNWRTFDVDAFAVDLQGSELIASPPVDVESGIDSYNSTLRALLDKHAPVELKRVSSRPSSARWYDRDCRDTKHRTRKLERQYRRLRTAESRAAWRLQFDAQRQLYQSKFTAYWIDTVMRVAVTRKRCGRLSMRF